MKLGTAAGHTLATKLYSNIFVTPTHCKSRPLPLQDHFTIDVEKQHVLKSEASAVIQYKIYGVVYSCN